MGVPHWVCLKVFFLMFMCPATADSILSLVSLFLQGYAVNVNISCCLGSKKYGRAFSQRGYYTVQPKHKSENVPKMLHPFLANFDEGVNKELIPIHNASFSELWNISGLSPKMGNERCVFLLSRFQYILRRLFYHENLWAVRRFHSENKAPQADVMLTRQPSSLLFSLCLWIKYLPEDDIQSKATGATFTAQMSQRGISWNVQWLY